MELCWKDLDGDGRINGEELGDLNCIWWENVILDKNVFLYLGIFFNFIFIFLF